MNVFSIAMWPCCVICRLESCTVLCGIINLACRQVLGGGGGGVLLLLISIIRRMNLMIMLCGFIARQLLLVLPVRLLQQLVRPLALM